MRALCRWLAAALLGLTGSAALSADADSSQRANLLRVGYLVNFVKFVEWPGSTSPDLLTVCFLGGAGIRDALAVDVANKRAGMRRLTTRELKSGESAQNCDVLYLDGVSGTLRSVFLGDSEVLSWGILTIGDEPDFVRHGGVIGLFTVDNRLRFSVNVENARRAGLKISSALLQLASSVDNDAS